MPAGVGAEAEEKVDELCARDVVRMMKTAASAGICCTWCPSRAQSVYHGVMLHPRPVATSPRGGPRVITEVS